MPKNSLDALQPAPPFDANPYIRADWLELFAIAKGTVFYSDLERVWEREIGSEDDNDGERDCTFDEILNETISIVQERITVTGGCYPFSITEDDSGIIFNGSDGLSDGQYVYLYCLFLSNMRVSSVYAILQEIDNKMRDTFQACAAWAASGEVKGCSYAFGWPRPDGSNFHNALKHVFHDLMADGDAVVQDKRPAGSSVADKDGGIDVISWRSRRDNHPGKMTFLGQVATGENWRNKSVIEYITKLTYNWFSKPPSTPCQPQMFIPFPIVPEDGATTVKDQLRYWTPQFGGIIYRDVLPVYAADGIEMASNESGIYCDRLDDVATVKAYVTYFCAAI